MKDLKLARFWVRNAFIGSIQVSFEPKEAMLESVCKDFAIRVKVLRARGLISSTMALVNMFKRRAIGTYLLKVRIAGD